MGHDNPPLVVSAVHYGRRVLFILASTRKTSEKVAVTAEPDAVRCQAFARPARGTVTASSCARRRHQGGHAAQGRNPWGRRGKAGVPDLRGG